MGEDKGLTPELLMQFKEAREYYKSLFEGGIRTIPSDALTVERINELDRRNKIYVSTLKELVSMIESDLETGLCAGMKARFKQYLKVVSESISKI